MGSILVNGSLTNEFRFQRGLRQGDPLSPFLFLLVMESLHVSVQKIVKRGLFLPIQVGNFQKVNLSHLLGSHDNVIAIARLLQCFYMPSGLNVNFHKSTLLGIDVPYHEVECTASNVGWKSEKLSFNYPGVKVSENMSRIESWKEVISKVSNKLSSWKIKTLSVGGRLTLLKSALGSLLQGSTSCCKKS
nr:RNA-directed DNA polymerase, eukaryota [Tanacetum cinerariifolium]